MASHAHHEPPNRGDIAYESFYSAAVGGLVVALFFLLADVFAGRILFTPSLLGSIIFLGADPTAVAGIDMTAVALFTVVHIVAFGILGLIATRLVRFIEEKTGGGFVPPALTLFVFMEGSFLAFDRLIAPGIAGMIGHGRVILANVLAATAMTLFLRYAHATSQAELAKEDGGNQAQGSPA